MSEQTKQATVPVPQGGGHVLVYAHAADKMVRVVTAEKFYWFNEAEGVPGWQFVRDDGFPHGDHHVGFVKAINAMVSDGWKLNGNFAVAGSGGNNSLYQWLYKNKAPKKPTEVPCVSTLKGENDYD